MSGCALSQPTDLELALENSPPRESGRYPNKNNNIDREPSITPYEIVPWRNVAHVMPPHLMRIVICIFSRVVLLVFVIVVKCNIRTNLADNKQQKPVERQKTPFQR